MSQAQQQQTYKYIIIIFLDKFSDLVTECNIKMIVVVYVIVVLVQYYGLKYIIFNVVALFLSLSLPFFSILK